MLWQLVATSGVVAAVIYVWVGSTPLIIVLVVAVAAAAYVAASRRARSGSSSQFKSAGPARPFPKPQARQFHGSVASNMSRQSSSHLQSALGAPRVPADLFVGFTFQLH